MRIPKPVLWHIVGCIAFLAVPLLLVPHPPEEVDYFFSRPTVRDFISNAFILGFFYLNYFILIPKFYFTNKYVAYGLCIALSFLFITTVPSILTGHDLFNKGFDFVAPKPGEVIKMPKPEGFTFIEEVRHNIFLFMSIVLFSVLLKTRNRLLDLEKVKHEAEITTLREQINPHFLFNTLNGLYALAVRDKSMPTASGILKLSSMMRYVVTETGFNFVSLEKEMSYVNDYIELQRLRLDKRIGLSYQVSGDFGDLVIAPLMLMPFIENAFKHGVNPDEESSISIQIAIVKNDINLSVKNNKVNVALSAHEKSGKGIENTRARLNLLYPQRHSLILADDERSFRVNLNIQLT